MQNAFSSRMVPQKVFESYTPIELQLKRMTLDNPEWMQKVMNANKSKMLRASRIEILFRQYINANFPLPVADPDVFKNYVLLWNDLVSPAQPLKSAEYKLWHASLPAGQVRYNYPDMNHRDEPTSFNLLR